MGQILDSTKTADGIRNYVKAQLKKCAVKPKLISIQVAETEAASVYIRNQKKQAEQLGIDYTLVKFNKEARYRSLLRKIREFNQDKSVTGIIVQLPLSVGLDTRVLHEAIDPLKDAEAMNPFNLGRILLGTSRIAPCTPSAVMALLDSHKFKLYGKNVVCVGHSNIVGKPLALMLLNRYATTTVCHIATYERSLLASYVKNAELLVVAVGKPKLIRGEWIKKGAIVIDVGINSVGGKIVGDVDFDPALKRASFITPVPGGIGPLTTAFLMKNVVELYKIQKENKG